MSTKINHSLKSQRLKHKLWIAYFLLSVIPALFLGYLLTRGFIIDFHKNVISSYEVIALLIGIVALFLMSISALVLLYRSISSLEQITQKTIRFVKEASQGNIMFDATNDETEELNACFMEMVQEIQHKISEVNKYAVALGETNKKLSQMAIKDGLTQLYNQIYIKERLEHEIKRAEQLNQPLSIMMLDIDDFKKYNDLHGHLSGDKCLREISNLIKDNIRSIDIPARYGGEEFLIVLPGAKSNEANQIAEKVRQSIANHQFQAMPMKGDKTASNTIAFLTASIGVSSYLQNAGIKTVSEFIRMADNALYQAKKKNKNQVVLSI